jgi:peptidoglycan/LPS O-acetylase OafA/YrhL
MATCFPRSVRCVRTRMNVASAYSNQSASATAPATRARFFVSLEAMRGVAALSVVIFHAVWTNPVTPLRFFQNGQLMVDFFFVLSGFVICHSYRSHLDTVAEGVRFIWLRVGRLYPLHLAFLPVFAGFEVVKYLAQIRYGI